MDFWLNQGWEWRFTWCGVGTRPDGLPEGHAQLQVWVGHCLALLGGVLCTGDAPGSDTNFYVGYKLGRGAKMPPAQIYYTNLKNQRNSTHSPINGYHELEMYPETRHIAQDMAYEARGSFNGLWDSGIALHTRNAFQVLSEDLQHPRLFTVFTAEPANKAGTKCKGGTNTAFQISRKNKIPAVNLWVEEERTKLIQWIKRQLVLNQIPEPELKGLFA